VVVLAAETGQTDSLIMVITLTGLYLPLPVAADAAVVVPISTALAVTAACASFGRGPPVNSHQQIQAMYKEKTWNFLFA
jgi:hypothetical protein